MKSLLFRSKIYISVGVVWLLGALILLATPNKSADPEIQVRITLYSLFGSLVVAYALSRYLIYTFEAPIKSLKYVARSITAGELRNTLSLDRKDEFGEMAEAINLMVVNLRGMNDDLREQVRKLRETKSELAETQNQMHLQERFMQQEKMASLGRLVAGVAHELNNPISFVYSNTVLLGQSVADLRRLLDFYNSCEGLPREIKEKAAKLKEEIDYDYLINDMTQAIEDCHEGSRRVRDIVLNLKTFSRANELQLQKIHIADTIESAVRMLGQFFHPDRVLLHREYADLPEIECYEGQLSQVWMNLLVNAAQAMNSRGEMWITTLAEGGHVIVKLRDNGPGIPEDVLTRIFDPFFTTKPIGQGTGLGLSIVHAIIERHGGNIKVESSAGAGTTFTVTLPLRAAARAEKIEKQLEGALV
ncbi:MAG TPA: ATP-binding protein [Blastocatellia bacterium]